MVLYFPFRQTTPMITINDCALIDAITGMSHLAFRRLLPPSSRNDTKTLDETHKANPPERDARCRLDGGCRPSVRAQQITGTPGSPSATVTIDGKQLPPPPMPFGGVIKESAKDSKPYWPPRVVPPKGAPNVLLIMTDDQGYGVSGTFGGVIPTPAMDRIAKAGLRYTQFHSTALCSPTRAALITGRNHHSVGFGVIGEMSTGYPGLRFRHRPGERHHRRDPQGEWLCHVVVWQEPQHAQLINTARPGHSTNGRRAWASSISTASWAARPTSGRPTFSAIIRQIFPWVGKPGYNLTTDLADEAIKYMSESERGRARQAVLPLLRARRHPLATPAEEGMDREVQRQVRHGLGKDARADLRQPEAARRDPGEYPAHPVAGLTLPKWDSLSLMQKKLYARQAEVFAGYAAYTDYEIGRVIQAVEDMGKLDNTLIIYISGDNGTSAEGTLEGTFNQMTAYNGILNAPRGR